MTSLETAELAGAGVEQAPEFRVTVLFENETVGRRAAQATHRLMEKFGESFMFRLAAASFTTLEERNQFAETLEFSRTADMIFVASESPLPETARRWLRECIKEHVDVPYALADMTPDGLSHGLGIDGSFRLADRRYAADVIRQEKKGAPSPVPTRNLGRCAHYTEGRYWGINE